ncbi:MAG: cytochrome c, partial [Bacteroidia bacterium]|nr:cytochrome c [Bacteroidia bacterium]
MKLYVVRIYALPFRVLILLILLYGIYSCTGNHSASDSIPTFSGNIAELIYHKCTPCHRNGSAAPFNLITYEDLKRHARTIKLTVSSRVMPPWPADPSYSTFLDQKSLTNEELAMLITWLDNGCPIGDKMKIPPPPKFPEGSKFGKPDLVLTMTEPFPIKGDNRDRFMMLKIPYELPSDTFIRGIEIVPGNTKVVHHINGHLVEYNIGAKKDLTKGEKWIDTETMGKREAFQKLDLANDDGTYPLLIPSVTNYLPGVEPAIYPEGIGGYSLKKKGVLLLDNIHYGPWPHDTTDQTSFNFFFSPVPPKRPTREFILGTSGITPVEPPLVIPP